MLERISLRMEVNFVVVVVISYKLCYFSNFVYNLWLCDIRRHYANQVKTKTYGNYEIKNNVTDLTDLNFNTLKCVVCTLL